MIKNDFSFVDKAPSNGLFISPAAYDKHHEEEEQIFLK